MPNRAGLAAKGNIRPGCSGAGNAGLSHNQVARANLAVMADMHQIINLGSLANYSRADSSTVYTGMGANLHIILKNHVAHLRHLGMHAILRSKPEAVRTNHGRAVHNNPGSHLAVLSDGSIGINDGIPANLRILADISVRIKSNPVTDDSIIIHKGHRHNGHILTNFYILADVCLRADPLLMDNRRCKGHQQDGKGRPGILHKDHRQRKSLLSLCYGLWQQHRTCPATGSL